ncbi:MAG: hypothetical protein U1E10_06405, partial [Bdellovibrionales bacterium]|nr:hypothetical protein [Bdellovibrionales bacterium]
MSHGRFLAALAVAVISNVGLSANVWAASGCEGALKESPDLPPSMLRATSDTMEKGQVMVSGFTIVRAGSHLSAVRADAPEGARTINRINAEPNFHIGRVARLSENEVVVEYFRDGDYYKNITAASSVQILKVESDGRFVPVQKFDGTETDRISLRDTIGESGLVLQTRGGLNSGNSVQVYRREAGGKFRLDGKLDRTEYTDVGPSVVDPNSYYVITRFSYFHKQDSLLRFVPGQKKPEVVLEGGKKDTPAGILYNPDPKKVFRLTGDYFGRGFTGSSSANHRDIEVFQVTKQGKAVKVGDLPLQSRGVDRRFARQVEAIDN